mmetsp:Transcript_14636/g.23739  ORF Transcript_14636/g.23739 Transcript_14636/m.23739 type:complete len:162 (-) Transcript_14636:86-571(-)
MTDDKEVDDWEHAAEKLDVGTVTATVVAGRTSTQMTELQDKLESLYRITAEEGKQRRIEFALVNMKIVTKAWVFGYGTETQFDAVPESVTERLLLQFRKGEGFDVTKYFAYDNLTGRPDHSNGTTAHEKFRSKLVDKLWLLLGHKPTTKTYPDGRTLVFYN